MLRLCRLACAAAIAAILGLAANTGGAQQTAFEQRSWGHDVEFSYRFRDGARQEHALSFRIPEREVEAAMASFREFTPGSIYQHQDAAIREAARRAGVQVRITIQADGSRSAQITGPADAVRKLDAMLPSVAEEARAEYLRQHLRRNEGNNVYIDYVAAVRRAVPVLRPLAQALRRQVGEAPERAVAQLALAFLQTIPYDDLNNVARFGGIDFAQPAAMLKINAGDCDSKAVAMAALMRHLLPARRLIIVRIPAPRGYEVGHVLLMADLAAERGDTTLEYRGRTYVALEAVGPALAPVGVVDERAAGRLDRPRDLAVEEVGR